ncbi:MAG: ATP-dependent helicase [Candidatus Omnitrophica bacterium]|nr:ATP-dependent helicase [Candidatus Omnitrophota bacterium]
MATPYTLHPSVPSTPPPRLDYRAALNAEQHRVVTEGDGHVLVLAGPGSGKTRTLIYRVAYLLERGVPPSAILLVTFTVKAAREMLARVEGLLQQRPDGLWGGTFHHIGNLILRQHADRLGLTPTFTILDEEDAGDLLAACLADLKLPTTERRLPQATVIGAILSLAVNTQRPIAQVVTAQYPYFAEAAPILERVAARYTQRKRQANAMDYDDLLLGWLRLLERHDDLRAQYADTFRYVLVDEYQDTNRLQFALVRQMGQGHGNILVVGDDAQSIYAFRGADVNNILEFPRQFPDTTIFKLEANYRSTPEILQVANVSIQHNRRQFPKALTTTRPAGAAPIVVPLVDTRQQAAFVAQRLLELRDEGTALEQMAVLFRARYQAAELELELTRRNIPYVIRGGVRFFEQTHIKDVLAYLKLLVNPADELAWGRTLRLHDGIGQVYAQRIWSRLQATVDPLQAAFHDAAGATLELPARARGGWQRFHRTLGALQLPEAPHQPGQVILEIVARGYRPYAEARFHDARDRLEDLAQLAAFAATYRSTDQLLADLSLREGFKGETITGWSPPDEHVVLSTIHQAKGLEWKSLFLLGMSDGQFPHPKSIDDQEALEEERRLFYVAVTRAKDELYLTYPLTRYSSQTGEVLMRPSRFLQELPETILDHWSVQVADPAFDD